MPWRQVYEPAPKNMSLKVWAELPPGVVEDKYLGMNGIREASTLFDELAADADLPFRTFFFCPYCGGWIEGRATSYEVSNLGFLSGRRGTEYFCPRCGEEIGFSGIMS